MKNRRAVLERLFPKKPGLGIEFEEKVAQKFRYIDGPWTEPWMFQ
ncbi:MAG: hypothetical protein QXI39_03610 [Candidatus Bathyarchaeia archaeon]